MSKRHINVSVLKRKPGEPCLRLRGIVSFFKKTAENCVQEISNKIVSSKKTGASWPKYIFFLFHENGCFFHENGWDCADLRY